MNISYVVNENTKVEYQPSNESTNLIDERTRKLLSENFHWDTNQCTLLSDLCIQRIRNNFCNNPLLDKLICYDKDYLLTILDTNLDLNLVVPLIDEEVYWKRRYHSKFGEIVNLQQPWKSLYIERYIQELIEQAEPQYNDEDSMNDITTLCNPYIYRLLLTQLKAWKPPLNWDEKDIPELYPIDHINFEPILKNLFNIVELGIIFGMNKVSDGYHKNMFEFSKLDCERLGEAINNYLKSLKILRIHRSKLNDGHCQTLMHSLIENRTLEIIDLSHCQIRNNGALCIAKVLCAHPKLIELNLCNNEISVEGAEGIGYAILKENCKLKRLDLRLNPLGHDGVMGILRALVRSNNIEELSLAGCYFEDDTPLRIGQMLQLNRSLIKFDVSNNWFDEDGGDALIESMEVNFVLQWFNVRNTNISKEQEHKINKCLLRNRGSLEDFFDECKEAENIEKDSDNHFKNINNVFK